MFDAWPGPEFDPDADYASDWTAGVDWPSIPDEDILDEIRKRSVPVIERRLARLWAGIGTTVAHDPVPSRIHARTSVESMHNGIPMETVHEAGTDGSTILVNDATADYTRHLAMGFHSWLFSQAQHGESRDQIGVWGSEYPVVRRVLAFESWSIAFGGLWQPVQLKPPTELLLAALYTTEWAITFWLGHELAHALRSEARRGETVTILGEDVTDLIFSQDPEVEESQCDQIAWQIALATPLAEFGGTNLIPPTLLLDATFLPMALAESRYYIRHARGASSFASRWAALHHIARERDDDPFVSDSFFDSALKFYQEVAYGTCIDWADRSLLDLIAESNFAEITVTQRRDSRISEISKFDDEVRLHLLPTSVVQRTAELLIQLRRTSGVEPALPIVTALLEFAAATEIPEYNETFPSRDYYLAVEAFRSRLLRMLVELEQERTAHDAVINPRGNVTFYEWSDAWPRLQDPIIRRILYEVASDRWPLVDGNTLNDDVPESPHSTLPFYGPEPAP